MSMTWRAIYDCSNRVVAPREERVAQLCSHRPRRRVIEKKHYNRIEATLCPSLPTCRYIYYNDRTLECVLNTCELARIRKSCRSWSNREEYMSQRGAPCLVEVRAARSGAAP